MKIINLSQVGKTSFVGKQKYVKKTQYQPEQKNNGKKLLVLGSAAVTAIVLARLAMTGKTERTKKIAQETLINELEFDCSGKAIRDGEFFDGFVKEITAEGETLTKKYIKGILVSQESSNGGKKIWPRMFNGEKLIETLPDGTEREFFRNQLIDLTLPDGTKKTWNQQGFLTGQKLSDGTKITWYDNGIPESMQMSDGARKTWSKSGFLTSDIHQNGSGKTWYDSGQLESVVLADGSKTSWPMSGNINFLKTEELWELNGRPECICLADGTRMSWNKKGQLIRLESSNGTIKSWDSKSGELVEIKTDIMLNGDIEPTSVHFVDNQDGTILLNYGGIGDSILSSDESREKVANGFASKRAREILTSLNLFKYIQELCL